MTGRPRSSTPVLGTGCNGMGSGSRSACSQASLHWLGVADAVGCHDGNVDRVEYLREQCHRTDVAGVTSAVAGQTGISDLVDMSGEAHHLNDGQLDNWVTPDHRHQLWSSQLEPASPYTAR